MLIVVAVVVPMAIGCALPLSIVKVPLVGPVIVPPRTRPRRAPSSGLARRA